MTTLAVLAPTHYLSGDGALEEVGRVALALGGGRAGAGVLLVHGGVGLDLVRPGVEAALERAGLRRAAYAVDGPCRPELAAAAARAALGASLLVGVGGGRVLDVTKAAAEAAGLACVLVPTSPATCAAATAVVVEYTPAGAYVRSRLTARSPAYALVDPAVLAAAPDRHLAAGLVDALAKVVEVRFGLARTGGGGAGAVAALALCDALETLVFDDGPGAVAAGRDTAKRREVAEAAVLWPGLVGALAGEGAKLAAAHAVHNALTLVPGTRSALHGEILAFGILVQLALEGRDDAEIERHARLFARLGCPMTLAELGAGAYLTDPVVSAGVLARALDLPSMRLSFPGIGERELAEAFAAAQAVGTALAGSAGAGVSRRSG